MHRYNGLAGGPTSDTNDAATERARQRMRELMRQFLRAPPAPDEADTVDLPSNGLGPQAAGGSDAHAGRVEV